MNPLALEAARAELCRRSFPAFVRGAWPVMEPARPLRPSVAIDALTTVLQEAADHGGRWAIACPPGVSKSMVAAIAYPAWLMLRSLGTARIMAGSYSWSLGERDSMRCRDLVTSTWYRGLVAGAWTLREDTGRKVHDWWTSVGGRRLVVSPEGKTTGERAPFQVIDDALSAADAPSAAARKDTARWLNEVLPSRLEDPEHDTRILIGQRLHPADPIGVALEQGGWNYLRLPALADSDPCELLREDGSLIWRDPRREGEPLVSLLSPSALARLKVELGSAAFAAQYQQEPSSDELAMFRRSWWRYYRPNDLPPTFHSVVIAADLTFGSTRGDYAVAQVWGKHEGKRFLLAQWRKRAGFEEQVGAIKGLADRWPNARILIEKAANGAAVIETLSRQMPRVIAQTPIGSKEQRAAAIVPVVESGACHLPEIEPWVGDFVEEFAGFGGAAKHDDQVDTATYALSALNGLSEGEAAIALAKW